MGLPHTDQGEYDLEVELTLFTVEAGGREAGLVSGTWHDHFALDGFVFIARYDLLDRERLLPGETGHVFVSFPYHPEALVGHLQPGKSFVLDAGFHPIGQGRIIALLDFEQHVKEFLEAEAAREATLADPKQPRIPPSWERPRHLPRKRKKNKP